jgi:hypothetical protein
MIIEMNTIPLYIYTVWTSTTKVHSRWSTRDEARNARRALRAEGVNNTYLTRAILRMDTPTRYED